MISVEESQQRQRVFMRLQNVVKELHQAMTEVKDICTPKEAATVLGSSIKDYFGAEGLLNNFLNNLGVKMFYYRKYRQLKKQVRELSTGPKNTNYPPKPSIKFRTFDFIRKDVI